MVSAARVLNRRPAFVVLFLAAGFILMYLTRTTYKVYEEPPPFALAKTWANRPTKFSLSVDNQTKKQNVTGDTGECDLDRKFMPVGSRPLLLLLSFPGSGNTWVRYLIERSTGIYSGSFYHDVGTGNDNCSVWRKSNPCSKTTLVVKSHGWENFDRIKSGGQKCKVEGAILIIRNPYGAILANFNRVKKGKRGTASASQFLTDQWKHFAESRSASWLKTNKKGMEIHTKLVVFYEDLVANTEYELRRMLDFLQVAHNKRRIACLMNDTVGKYKREHKELGINPYSAEINRTIDAKIRTFREYLQSNSNIELPPYESNNPS
ncbi:WSC domain-containing protein 1 [Holothuria leucospilota]|uniref:WSC domain-containing protein 1 n=1 Tax=Holothuria leucospilota TaxID=206669 RepID=A0A9Q1CKI1_HOLLE|nr:WSC domain-containing protein 1 [Holothuria leucospilota]